MEVANLPVPDIREFDYQPIHKQATRREDSNRLRPPKLKYANRSFPGAAGTATPHAISFRELGDSMLETNLSQTQKLSSSYDRSMNQTYFEQCFTRLAKIGEGSFGEVYKVRSKEDGFLYAVKISKQLFRSSSYRKERLEEVRRYEQFSGHANCVHFYRAWEQNDRLYMQMELCRESLEQYLLRKQNISEDKVWAILLDLLLALKSLHDRNLIHLDIKLDNVLIGDDHSCKLADFGLVVDVDKAVSHQTTEGDSRYMAPEIMEGNFSKAADIFSLGIAMLELACCLELPANGPLWQRLRKGVTPEDFIKPISAELQDIIKLMMTPEPRKRPTVDQLLKNKKLISILHSRKHWQVIKKVNHKLRRSRHLAWTKLCNLKRLLFHFLTGLFSTLKWQLKSPRTRDIDANNMEAEVLTQNSPSPVILCSTPTVANKHEKMGCPTQSDFIGDDCYIEPIGKSTPRVFITCNDRVAISTPQHYFRSRKDLTKTDFKLVDSDNNNDAMNIDEATPNYKPNGFSSLDDFEMSNSFMRKSYDTSSLRKKLFMNEDSD